MRAHSRLRGDGARAPRAAVAMLTLVATLLAMPGVCTGRFVCTRGMAAAGPACPKCGPHARAHSVPAPAGKCCTHVVADPVAAVPSAAVSLTKPEASGWLALAAPSGCAVLASLDPQL